MTARRDPESLIQAYLEDGPTELADRSYDAVRTEIDHRRQRVVIGPWRVPTHEQLRSFRHRGRGHPGRRPGRRLSHTQIGRHRRTRHVTRRHCRFRP